MKRLGLFFLILIFLSACGNKKKPEGILDEKKMMQVLTDIHLVDAYFSVLPYNDTLRSHTQEYYDAVYKKYKISKSEFDKSLKYYSRQPALLDSMYSQILTNLKKKEQEQSKVLDKKNDLPQ